MIAGSCGAPCELAIGHVRIPTVLSAHRCSPSNTSASQTPHHTCAKDEHQEPAVSAVACPQPPMGASVPGSPAGAAPPRPEQASGAKLRGRSQIAHSDTGRCARGSSYTDLRAASPAPAMPTGCLQDPPKCPPGLRGLHGLADSRAHLVSVHDRRKRDLGAEPLADTLSRPGVVEG